MTLPTNPTTAVQAEETTYRHPAASQTTEPDNDEVNDDQDDEVVHDDLLADKEGDVDNLVEERDYTAPA